mmetsp:Transcript_22212/g.39110  ORF Transcript_22212/g.39110 Transcript_22212/m.39110 type:complete len:270 (+) Transcript_22212:60-869(+)
MAAEAFAFTVPECSQGATLKIPAPDGVSVMLPLQENVLPGDEVHMEKSDDGSWSVAKVLRGAPGALASSPVQWRAAEDLAEDCASPNSIKVRFDTTKGPIYVNIVPKWAPKGAERFLQLVDDDYFHDIAIYRGIEGGLLQFGIVRGADDRSAKYSMIEDDPLIGIPYAEGMFGFAAAGPGTRKSTMCIMKADFRSQLGKGKIGTPSPETPVGMVCPESMETMHSIACIGDVPQCGGKGADPKKIEELGNDYIRKEFPTCDFVTGAARVQ